MPQLEQKRRAPGPPGAPGPGPVCFGGPGPKNTPNHPSLRISPCTAGSMYHIFRIHSTACATASWPLRCHDRAMSMVMRIAAIMLMPVSTPCSWPTSSRWRPQYRESLGEATLSPWPAPHAGAHQVNPYFERKHIKIHKTYKKL